MVNVGAGAIKYTDMGAHEFQGASPMGTVTGQVILEDGADAALVTITAGGQTAVKTPGAGVIDYAISGVPVVTTDVTVTTSQPLFTVAGSPALIAWAGPTGAAAGVTVTAPAVDDGGCTAGRGSPGAWLLSGVLLFLVVTVCRKRRRSAVKGSASTLTGR
jgi:hypothetical protein